MFNHTLYKGVSGLCFEGFDKLRRHCASLYPDLDPNKSIEAFMDDFVGSESEWSDVIKEITNGEHKRFHK